jgi:hypothetical protein
MEKSNNLVVKIVVGAVLLILLVLVLIPQDFWLGLSMKFFD